MKDCVSSKTCSLFVISTLFFVFSCSHTPTNTVDDDVSSITNEDITPDFIVPPLSSLKKNIALTDNNYQEQDIWNHIAKKLTLSEFYNHPRVVTQKLAYLNKPEYLATVSRRSETFIHFVLSEVERRNLPAELAIVPIVESSYSPKARSRAKAEGLWQFMSYTAKEYGLQRSYGYDGRHDVYASTIAALNYLEQLNKQFDGNWLLSLAAYNAGPHRVNRALHKEIKTTDENSYWNLKLPRETRNYIPKILAFSAIVNDRNLSATLLHPIIDEAFIEPVVVDKRISPSKLIQASGIDAIEIQKLNPALRNLKNPLPDGYRLLVPKEQTQLIAITIKAMPEETFLSLEKHTIENGESLSVIASKYGTSVAVIKETNNLSGSRIVAGRTLLIPPYGNQPIQSSASKKQAASKSRETSIPYFYVVTMGDSYWAIASRNNTTVDRLAKINGRNPNQPLRPGESILID